MAEISTIRCSGCGMERPAKLTSNGNARLPARWKRRGGDVYCQRCWRERYMLRAVALPVVCPVGCDWPELRAAMTRCWDHSTKLANWAMAELAKADVTPSPGDEKLPPMQSVYLYPKARQRFPDLAAKSVVALLHTVDQRYRSARLATVWHCDKSLQRFRFPLPYPVPAQGWSARYGEGKVPLIELQLLDRSFTLRLRCGPHYRRQLAAFAKIVSGDAVRSELTIYRKRASAGDHRSSVQDRAPGGGQRVHYRLMAKLVAWLPRLPTRQRCSEPLCVATASQAFLIATMQGRAPWVLNADHVRRWAARHRRTLNRVAEDFKHEKRWPKRARRHIADYREAIAERHHRRTDTFCNQAASMIAGLAQRRGVAEVHYDDRDRSYLGEFPWSHFRAVLSRKLDDQGIRLVILQSAADEVPATEAA